jgi:hypothetical protein
LRGICGFYSQDLQLVGIGVPAFRGLGPLVCCSFDQPELARSICLRPLECGDKFGMGSGVIHKVYLVKSVIFGAFVRE